MFCRGRFPHPHIFVRMNSTPAVQTVMISASSAINNVGKTKSPPNQQTLPKPSSDIVQRWNDAKRNSGPNELNALLNSLMRLHGHVDFRNKEGIAPFVCENLREHVETGDNQLACAEVALTLIEHINEETKGSPKAEGAVLGFIEGLLATGQSPFPSLSTPIIYLSTYLSTH